MQSFIDVGMLLVVVVGNDGNSVKFYFVLYDVVMLVVVVDLNENCVSYS